MREEGTKDFDHR